MLFHFVEKKKRSRPMSPKAQLEQEKRNRREIANSNERRRMQCINAGFQSLRELMPQLSGEKLSKAAILQHTTDYIAKLEDEKNRIKIQNENLRRLLSEVNQERESDRCLANNWENHSPPPKRKKRDTESSDEGISMGESAIESSKDMPSLEDIHRELIETRQQVERERMVRLMMEQRNRDLEAQLTLNQSRHSHLSSMLPSPINLKVETHIITKGSSPGGSNVQEVSAHSDGSEDRTQPPADPYLNPQLPARRNLENLVEAIRQIEGDSVLCADTNTNNNKFMAEEVGAGRYAHHPHAHSQLHHNNHHHSHHNHNHHHSHHHSHPHHAAVLNSEESEKESSVSSSDDPEECSSPSSSKSESLGHDSPPPTPTPSLPSSLGLCAPHRLTFEASATTTAPTPIPQTAHQGILSEKYPIASHLLHRPYNQFYRPGVIVHKS